MGRPFGAVPPPELGRAFGIVPTPEPIGPEFENIPMLECIRVVQDNLSTHTAGALYEAFAPTEARRILRRFGVPLHPQARKLAQTWWRSRSASCAASAWTAEFDHSKRLVREIAAWQRQRNAASARIKWMFTTEKARTKMGRAYPCPPE